jgi:hypothetical protein
MPQSEKTHPHLFFRADDLPAIRAKTEHPRFRGDWEALRAQAEEDLKGSAIRPEEEYARLGAGARRAARAAFVYTLTGDRRFADRARAFFDALLAEPDWTYHPNDNRFGQSPSALCHHLALTYDLLANEMSAAERARLIDACRRQLIDVFLADCKAPDSDHLNGVRTMNHLAVRTSAAGCLLLALHGDGVDFDREIEIARSHLLRFVEWYDDAGASLEIGGYWTYGMGNALRCLAALRGNGWPGIFRQRSGKLRRSAYPLLMMSVGGTFVANFSDSHHGRLSPEARASVLILAAEFQDPRLQWFAEQMTPGHELALICGDSDLPAAPPDDLPTCVAYHGCGVGILRSSLSDPDALFLGLKAGRARGAVYDDPHCQFDLNSVVLEAYGRTLLADPGYLHVWDGSMDHLSPTHISNSTPPHNTLLVDGAGQVYAESPIAHLQDLSPDDSVDYLVSRIEQGYGPHVRRFDRHAYLVAKRMVVLVDEVELSSPGTLTWNFHGAKESTLSPGEPARIVNGEATLLLQPFGATPLTCRCAGDHVLPRLQWDTHGNVASVTVGWLLLPHRRGASAPDVTAAMDGHSVLVQAGSQSWILPIVSRRATCRSDIMLPFTRSTA